ncbi:MAG: hypothetical protein JWP74_516 [Marmoricola sp.]|nr:hypothetical protein [Marmoricola sp.]
MVGLVLFLVVVALCATALAAFMWGHDDGQKNAAKQLRQVQRDTQSQMEAVTRAALDAAHRSARNIR